MEELATAPPVNVTVSFWKYNLLNASNSTTDEGYAFVFNPAVLTMQQNSPSQTNFTVNFNLDTTSVLANLTGVALASCSFNGSTGSPPGFQQSVQNNGSLQATFNNGGLSASTTYDFTVSVTYGGTTYTSSDPEIVLPPPGGG